MTLIRNGAVKPWAEGMNPDALDLTPGQPPPFLSPHCWKCRLPVEVFTIDWIRSPHYLPVQYQCCGRTGGYNIPREEVLYKSKHGGVIWVNTELKVSNGRR